MSKKPQQKGKKQGAQQDKAKEKKEEKKSSTAGNKYVRDMADVKCSCGSSPAKLKVTANPGVFLQDVLKATSKDKTITPNFGTCSAQRNSPCQPALMEWQDIAADVNMGDQAHFLLERSTNQCSAGGGKVTITSGKQQSTVQNITPPAQDLPIAAPLEVKNKEVVWLASNEVYNDVPAADLWYKVEGKTFKLAKLTAAVIAQLQPDPVNNTIFYHTEKGVQTTYKKGVSKTADYGNKLASADEKLHSAYPLYLRNGVFTNAYPTYKLYVYKGENAGDAKQKVEQDINANNHGKAALMLEIARHTRDNNTDYMKNGGPVPPTGFNGQPEFYALNYTVSSTPRFRVVLDKTDTSALTIVEAKKRGDVSRAGISIDPFVSADLEGCLGIRDGKGGYFQALTGGKSAYFTALNDKLIDKIPELLNIYRVQTGTGKMAKKKFDAKEEALFFVKVDPLPELSKVEIYDPWKRAIDQRRGTQPAGQQSPWQLPAQLPSNPLQPTPQQRGGVWQPLRPFGNPGIRSVLILVLLQLCFAAPSFARSLPVTATHTLRTDTSDAFMKAIDSGDSTQLLQLLAKGYNPNAVILPDTSVQYSDLGTLPIRIKRYTPFTYVIDYNKNPKHHFFDDCKGENSYERIKRKQGRYALLLIRHGYHLSAEDLELLLLTDPPADQFKSIVQQSRFNIGAAKGNRLAAAALRGNCPPALLTWLLDQGAGTGGVTDAIRHQYARDYTISVKQLEILEQHHYRLYQDAGFNLLHYAVYQNDLAAVKKLLAAGVPAKQRTTWFYHEDDMTDGGSAQQLTALDIARKRRAQPQSDKKAAAGTQAIIQLLQTK
nr:PAAR-like protein [uncultured Chitinophaga sp.]